MADNVKTRSRPCQLHRSKEGCAVGCSCVCMWSVYQVLLRSLPLRFSPWTGWTWQTSIEEGLWANWGAEPVDIPAALGHDGGVWYRIRQGIRGVLVHDEQGEPVAYLICEPASHYYAVMTRSRRMPVLLGERI